MDEAQLRVVGLDHYRRLVALLYREIGVLQARNHPLAQKANTKDPLFAPASRKQRAKDVYRLTLLKNHPAEIRAAYETRAGLTLEDLHEAFANGKWHTNGRCSYGGPRWAVIAATTIQLGNALQQESWADLAALLATVKTLEHNNGKITDKYPQLD